MLLATATAKEPSRADKTMQSLSIGFRTWSLTTSFLVRVYRCKNGNDQPGTVQSGPKSPMPLLYVTTLPYFPQTESVEFSSRL